MNTPETTGQEQGDKSKKRTKKDTQFKPGQSGNPAGRPPGSLSLIGLMKSRLAQVDPQTKRTYAEQFIDNILQDAADLDGPSRKLVLNYIEGMPKQQVELSGEVKLPAPILGGITQSDGVPSDHSGQENTQS